jgi:hypothetical protein
VNPPVAGRHPRDEGRATRIDEADRNPTVAGTHTPPSHDDSIHSSRAFPLAPSPNVPAQLPVQPLRALAPPATIAFAAMEGRLLRTVSVLFVALTCCLIAPAPAEAQRYEVFFPKSETKLVGKELRYLAWG